MYLHIGAQGVYYCLIRDAKTISHKLERSRAGGPT
jgi:hypothetical protein